MTVSRAAETEVDVRKNEASARYQVQSPDFCGVDIKVHEAFCAGWDQALARSDRRSQLETLIKGHMEAMRPLLDEWSAT